MRVSEPGAGLLRSSAGNARDSEAKSQPDRIPRPPRRASECAVRSPPLPAPRLVPRTDRIVRRLPRTLSQRAKKDSFEGAQAKCKPPQDPEPPLELPVAP